MSETDTRKDGYIMSKALSKTLNAKGMDIRTILGVNNKDYISLTDIAKYRNPNDPRFIIQNWMRNRDTIEFLGLWELLNNKKFNRLEFDTFKNSSGRNSFVLTPQQWIENTNAIGIQSKSGRYGGTYAHTDIAFEFASWVSPEFKLYIIKDYQRLKSDEAFRNEIEWNARMELARTNYRIHTDAIKEHIIPQLPANIANITYANEADVLNMALFGKTAKQWRDEHPDTKGNIRDEASALELIILVSLENLNAEFIKNGMPQSHRLIRLREIVQQQIKSLSNSSSVAKIEKQI